MFRTLDPTHPQFRTASPKYQCNCTPLCHMNKTGSLLKSLFVKATLSLHRWIVLDDIICNLPGCPHLQTLTIYFYFFNP